MRLDLALVQRSLARSRNQAASLIADGQVLVNSKVASKASTIVSDSDDIQVIAQPFVARSAGKLAGALRSFGVKVPAVCLDVGASTGGFTEVLLQEGAELVFALDVGHGQLAPELASDPRVVNLEGQNIRDLTPATLGPRAPEIGLIVVDLSFISLKLVAPKLIELGPKAEVIALIKPQFELDRSRLNKHGVVTERQDRHRAVAKVIDAFLWVGYGLDQLEPSEVVGNSGNQEYLAHFTPGALGKINSDAIAELV